MPKRQGGGEGNYSERKKREERKNIREREGTGRKRGEVNVQEENIE